MDQTFSYEAIGKCCTYNNVDIDVESTLHMVFLEGESEMRHGRSQQPSELGDAQVGR